MSGSSGDLEEGSDRSGHTYCISKTIYDTSFEESFAEHARQETVDNGFFTRDKPGLRRLIPGYNTVRRANLNSTLTDEDMRRRGWDPKSIRYNLPGDLAAILGDTALATLGLGLAYLAYEGIKNLAY